MGNTFSRRLRILNLSVACISVVIVLVAIFGAISFLSQPAWMRNLQIASWSSSLPSNDSGPGDELAQAAIHECFETKSKSEQAKIFLYALLHRDPNNAHEGEEIAEAVTTADCASELSSLIRRLPDTEWDKMSLERKRDLQGFLTHS